MLPDTTEVGLLTEHTENIEVGNDDVLKRIAWRIKRSVSFFVLYIVLIILNAFVLIWEIAAAGKDNHAIVIILEAMINIIFIVELSVEILTQADFWKSCWNRVDVVICVLCVMMFITFLLVDDTIDKKISEEKEIAVGLDDLDQVLLFLRYTIMLFRTCRFAKVAKREWELQRTKENDVVFTEKIASEDSVLHGKTTTAGGASLSNASKLNGDGIAGASYATTDNPQLFLH